MTKAATAATAAAAAADAAAATAAAAMAAAGFIAAAPGTGVVAVGYPAVNAYLVAQGAAAVVAGYLDPAVLAAAPAPTAAECAQMAGLPAAEVSLTYLTGTMCFFALQLQTCTVHVTGAC